MMRLGTIGGETRPGGSALWSRLLLIVVPVGVIVQVSINAMTRISDSAALGRPIAPHVAWEVELTSGAAILLLLPVIWKAVALLRPARFGLLLTITGHIGTSIVFSLGHVLLMSGMRLALWGHAYVPVPSPSILIYEYRKDAWTYALLAIFLALVRRLAAEPMPSRASSAPSTLMLMVSDGARRRQIAVEQIDYVEAAGNYVEIVIDGDRLLHRTTLVAIAHQLGDGFVRIHRSRLIRRTAIRLIETNQSGDFEIETTTGDRVKGSRRYRQGLNRADS